MAITEKQRLAIESEGNVLVSASAGAGKKVVWAACDERIET